MRLIPSAPGYAVTADGEVYRDGEPVRCSLTAKGYRKLTIRTLSGRRTVRVSVVVCTAYHGERPPGHEVRHLNGRRDDDRACNLAWATHRENCADKVAHGTAQRGERNPKARLTEAQVRAIRASQEPAGRLALVFGVKAGTVRAVRARRRWAHL